MADIRLIYNPVQNELGFMDFQMRLGDLDTRNELETAVLISLFTDRRAELDDRLPSEGESRRGWFGDALAQVEGDRIGSRLWLLYREKQNDSTLNRARDYCREALQWLVDDGIADKVELDLQWLRQGVMGICVYIYRPQETDTFRFDYLWQQLALVQAPTKAELGTPSPSYILDESGNFIYTESGERILAE